MGPVDKRKVCVFVCFLSRVVTLPCRIFFVNKLVWNSVLLWDNLAWQTAVVADWLLFSVCELSRLISNKELLNLCRVKLQLTAKVLQWHKQHGKQRGSLVEKTFWLQSSLCWWSHVLRCVAFLCRDCSLDGDSCFSRKDHTCTTWILSTRSWKERSPGPRSCVLRPRTSKPSLFTQYVTVQFLCLSSIFRPTVLMGCV